MEIGIKVRTGGGVGGGIDRRSLGGGDKMLLLFGEGRANTGLGVGKRDNMS